MGNSGRPHLCLWNTAPQERLVYGGQFSPLACGIASLARQWPQPLPFVAAICTGLGCRVVGSVRQVEPSSSV